MIAGVQMSDVRLLKIMENGKIKTIVMRVDKAVERTPRPVLVWIGAVIAILCFVASLHFGDYVLQGIISLINIIRRVLACVM